MYFYKSAIITVDAAFKFGFAYILFVLFSERRSKHELSKSFHVEREPNNKIVCGESVFKFDRYVHVVITPCCLESDGV